MSDKKHSSRSGGRMDCGCHYAAARKEDNPADSRSFGEEKVAREDY